MERKLLRNGELPRISAPKAKAGKSKSYFGSRGSPDRHRRYKRWFVCYIFTASLVLMATLLLFLFGVDESGGSLIEGIGLHDISDKIATSITDIFFFDFTKDKSEDGDIIRPNLPENDIDDTGDKDQTSGEADKNPTTDKNDDKTENDIYYFDYSLVPSGYTPIIPMDLSLLSYGEKYINNSTGYSPILEQLLHKELFKKDGDITYSQDTPRVLIIHTHGTEAYSPNDAIYCESVDAHGRSNDREENVVSIGKIIADILNGDNIPTIHCTVMHDSTQYKDSYSRAAETIQKYLAEYPSIELVIDVHRDAIIKSSGEIVKPITEVDGKKAAQVMCVVGTDYGGEGCPRWEDNLSLALQLRGLLNDSYGNICRPVALKSSTYNQEFSRYSILLEIGSSGNSLEEARIAAELVAKAIVDLLK